jgi:hypothetical protein
MVLTCRLFIELQAKSLNAIDQGFAIFMHNSNSGLLMLHMFGLFAALYKV